MISANDFSLYYKLLALARNANASGKNIVQTLVDYSGDKKQSEETAIIEISYDIQAGSYTKMAEANAERLLSFTGEAAELISDHAGECETILDAGCGELTSTSNIINAMANKPDKVLAFDLCLSRLIYGLEYWKKTCDKQSTLIPFVAEFAALPLPSNSIDVTFTVHALEPNQQNFKPSLAEIFRVSVGKVILFEPCYERASKESQSRMDKHGYMRNLERTIEDLDGKIIDITEIKNPSNALNPTFCFVVDPPKKGSLITEPWQNFSLPGSSLSLIEEPQYLISNDTGLLFPKICGIPVLRVQSAIIASALAGINTGATTPLI